MRLIGVDDYTKNLEDFRRCMVMCNVHVYEGCSESSWTDHWKETIYKGPLEGDDMQGSLNV